jgi:hypothetical protein
MFASQFSIFNLPKQLFGGRRRLPVQELVD